MKPLPSLLLPLCALLLALGTPLKAADGSPAAPAPAAEAVVDPIRKVVLTPPCEDPMELAPLPDGRVLFIERGGTIKLWRPEPAGVQTIATLPVFHNFNGSKQGGWEDGLIGVTLDPGFTTNRWLYFYYSPTNASENRVSRFQFTGEGVDLASERVLLKVATQRDICCHAGGSLAFDGAGNLLISTGDNTNPFESEGYAPIDYRPGRYGWDAGKSSGNTADLRGKILRIHPEPDGTYTIPAGNLFAPGTPRTRPEIFVMGCRNPFRISIDKPTGTLFWGEVGPDAQGPSPERGPAGFDEFNRTRTAGNFGWPFVIADNKPYRYFDFATRTPGSLVDVQKPENRSPMNTGLTELPAAQPAWIWYPYAASTRFPTLGSGGRTACAGPLYHFDEKLASSRKLPRQYDNTLFLYDWARNWIRAVKLDTGGNILSIRPFAAHIPLKRPVEMELGPDGCLYVIEFGTNWEKNKDSQVIRLESTGPGEAPQGQ
ncbi:MAG TPA: glycosyl hydrolase [Verrucomicrobiales bacterium]|nr:glycosyl hydrolase [Verrucomicrobiales bacterium]